MEKLTNYIGGKQIPPTSQNYIDSYNPATGEVHVLAPDSDERDVEQAVDACAKSINNWASTTATERSSILKKIAQLIQRDLEKLAAAETNDNGKPLSLAKTIDIPRASSNFEFFASAITQYSSEAHVMGNSAINYTLRDPLGIVGCISPWNLPLYLFTWKIAPALATGNCVVAKPSEITPLTAYLFGQICQEAGLPPGVLNIIQGYGHKVGSAITKHSQIVAISFTGGTRTGAEIAKIAAPLFKKLSLELGGKNPNIIFADCNYKKMMDFTLRSSFANQGQICLCGSRIFIERPIFDKFVEDFVARTQKLKVGDPLLAVDQGAIVSQEHMKKVLSYIELAKEEGGNILCGGKQVKLAGRCANGSFVTPTVITNLAYDCRTNQEEIFGPVVTLTPFDTEEQVVNYANSTQYGLASTVWTENLTRGHKMAAKLKSGIVWVNCWMVRDLRTPFGGTKSSGVGREGGAEVLRFFTEPKNVCIHLE